MRRAVPSLLLLLAATAPAMPNGARLEQRQRAELEATDEIIVYKTKPGDTLKGLATRWFANPEDWRRAMALNKVKDPNALAPGTPLRLRSTWLKTNPIRAELAAFRGDVRVVRKTAGLPVMKGMELAEGDLVETGPNGFATLTLPDNSQVSLPSASRIRLARLRQVPMSDSIDRRFTLEQGRSEARVTPMSNPASRFLITTPVAVAAVRGTQYVVTYTPAEMTALTAVTEGKVAVQRKGGIEDVLVRAGFGNLTTRNGATKPIALLPAPEVETPERVQDAEKVTFRIRPVAGATRYRVEIATDEGFVDRVGSVDIDGDTATFEGVPDGKYKVRAFALDALGLSGQAARPVSFERSWTGNQRAAAEQRAAERREQIAELGTDAPTDFNWFDNGASGNGELLLAAAGSGGFGGGSGDGGGDGGGDPLLPVDSGTPLDTSGQFLLGGSNNGGSGGPGGQGGSSGGPGGGGGFGGGGFAGGGGGGGGGFGGGGNGGPGSNGTNGNGTNGSSPGANGPGGNGSNGLLPGTIGGIGGLPSGNGSTPPGSGSDGSPGNGSTGNGGNDNGSTGTGNGGTGNGGTGNGATGNAGTGEGGSGSGGVFDPPAGNGPGGPATGNGDGVSGPSVISVDPVPPQGSPAPPVEFDNSAPPPSLPTPNPVQIGAIPEPSTWIMLIAGFGLAGFALRRRRSSAGLA
jgi:hypothetical protein